ncbi:MAG: DUF3696 domain-containing protein [Alkalinema sp. RU_4_3]|nr:DUF3696 domain-containing protein [Alkalinema sp. RU_4_3]
MTQTADNPKKAPSQPEAKSPLGFTEIGVSGFKSFSEETRIQLGSLTILAGANSSGKSSIMQPLLLMKQTLEAYYDPGALLLDGPNISFTSGEQFLSKLSDGPRAKVFSLYLAAHKSAGIRITFDWSADQGMDVLEQSFLSPSYEELRVIKRNMSNEEIEATLLSEYDLNVPRRGEFWRVERTRCFLKLAEMNRGITLTSIPFFNDDDKMLSQIIHVQGLRESPRRIYGTAAVKGSIFVGRFENYVASLINQFQQEAPEQLVKLQKALGKLGLTEKIQAQRLNDSQIELRVGRVLGSTGDDMVNITDVGFGVSQMLPVIVALLVAQPGQLVYIEQPEIHLHPLAQVAIAEIFAEAASRGVRVVIETHSELFLMGIQALVAEDKLDPNAVKLHWFTRQADGSSKVTSADLDEMGAFGDWPEDFGSTSLGMTNRYLSAAEAKLWSGHNGNASHG